MSLSGNEQLRAFMDKLTATTNVSKYIELPMIAVMGDTSSGKSSLLSSISGVELPSSSELTTRCPIMLQMKRSEQKKATVSVQWKDVPDGKVKKEVEFETIVVEEDQWGQHTSAIEKAQKHIIKIAGKEVARDVVLVKVEGPTCEDLTLVDLPGIVRSRGKDEGETIVEDIKALIDDYLKNNRCVILAVVPANVDFHNSQIMADAQKVDPETKRTIPVITKPDLIDTGAEGDVEELLLGRKTVKFQMGFHMVKGRGQAQLDNKVTIEEEIQNEEAFFSNTQPWRSVANRKLFGTQLLRKKLGELQLDLIRETLPAIMKEIKEKHELASAELKEIGDIPETDAQKRLFFQEISEEIKSSILSKLQGNKQRIAKRRKTEGETFASKLHTACGNFRDTLAKSSFANLSSISVDSKVLVRLATGEDISGKVVGITSDDEMFIDYQGRETEKCEELASWTTWEKSNNVPKKPEGTKWQYKKRYFIAAAAGYDELKGISADRVRRDPSWLLTHINNNRTDDLPVFVNPAVFQSVLVEFIDTEWLGPCHALVEEAQIMIFQATWEALSETTKLSYFPKMKSFLFRQLEDRIQGLQHTAEEHIEEFVEKERNPYTQNHYLHENLAKQRFDPLFQALETALGLEDKNMKQEMKKSSIRSTLRAIRDQNQRKSVEEHMVDDMQNMLVAYAKVALKRFVDGIPMECWRMFRVFSTEEVKYVLMRVTDNDLNRYLVVHGNALRNKQELTLQVQELKAGMDVIESL